MKLLEKYMPAIERSPRRTSLYLGTDVLFLTVRRARMEWGDFRRSRSNIPMVRETVVLAITAHGTFRLEPISHKHQAYLDRIVSKVKYGSIDSILTLTASLNKQTPYGVPYVRMTQTKLEYYL